MLFTEAGISFYRFDAILIQKLSKMLKILLSFFLFSICLNLSACEGFHFEEDETFIHHDFKKLQEKDQQFSAIPEIQTQDSNQRFGPMSTMKEYFLMQKEVDQLIGIHDEEIDTEGHVKRPADLTNLKKVLDNNKKWTKQKTNADPEYFKRHKNTQRPNYLWIGCSDSRLPANQILGLDYGEVFVLRNVANMVSPSDISSLAVIQYAVEILEVKDIIIAGHYGCGGVKAAVTKYNHGPLEAWLSKLRRIRHKHAHVFLPLKTLQEKAKLLVEINVKQQVFNVASTPFVQQAWKDGKQLRIHGLVFNLQTGRLVDLNLTMHKLSQLPEELAVVEND